MTSTVRVLFPIVGVPPSRPHHLLKAPTPNILTFGVRISIHEYGVGGHQHSDQSMQERERELSGKSLSWPKRMEAGTQASLGMERFNFQQETEKGGVIAGRQEGVDTVF